MLLMSSCWSEPAVIQDEEAYAEEIKQWQESRIEKLKQRNGWLNLAGLYWLEEGESTFGSDKNNDIVFPGKAEAFCGTLTLAEGKISLKVVEGVEITLDSIPVSNLALSHDQEENTTRLEQGDLGWYIIKRGNRSGIRLRDYRHPRIDELDHIPSYPVNAGYVVEANLEPFDEPRTMTVATPVEGFTESYQCPGELHFKLNKKDLVLYHFEAGNGYFLVIADATSGMETYGAGRFMYAVPDSTGRIVLDFNKAYNPPCAFSPFATCPMPPPENYLQVAIEAGEKEVHLH